MLFWNSKASSLRQLKKFVQAANYISAAQIYLQENFFLNEPLKPEHIKERLLGHWGTVPGINFVYAFCNYLIKKYEQEMMFILGPGHGFPGLQANLFLEGSLSKISKKIPYNEKGLCEIIRNFSWPYGYPSHSNPGAPGVILEGGELGYALATSYGAAFDNPNLIVTCLIGDGEAETGATATAWHSNKFLDPKTCGAVLPILHVNGYKISGPTIFGRMSNRELENLFSGYGYLPIIVEGKNLFSPMRKAMERAYGEIKAIQKKARNGKKPIVSPRWPMIILKSPKGWTGIHKIGNKLLEGNFLSHQVIAGNCKHDPEELRLVEEWFASYNFQKHFNPKTGFSKSITDVLPPQHLRMGMCPHAFGGKIRKPLKLPDINAVKIPLIEPGQLSGNSMFKAGDYLRDVFHMNRNEKNFRLFSPDETYSNRIMAVFEQTKRAFVWPLQKNDQDMGHDGRVMEMLSEQNLQGFFQGYILSGRHGVFASYEAFIQIVSSMVDQYAKFIKASAEFPWRKPVSSMNYILSSLGWRQDHNGYSHQNPGFISNMLVKHGNFISVYFPADANGMLVTLEDCLTDTNRINVIVAGKNYLPQWRTLAQARDQQKKGLATWDFASHQNPDIVFASSGDYPTQEALAAVNMMRFILPSVKVRYVNVSELTALGLGDEKKPMSDKDFVAHFTKDKPIIFNFHGYPDTIKRMFFARSSGKRIVINGYTEEGSTTTPFDLQIRNHTSRYQLVSQACASLEQGKVISKSQAAPIKKLIVRKLDEHRKYIIQYGIDPDELANWKWGQYPAELK